MSQMCEFCNANPGVVILNAENQEVPTFSVCACVKCFTEFVLGRPLMDIFGWTWSIDEKLRVVCHKIGRS